VTLRWPRDLSPDEVLIAHSLRQQGGEAFARPASSPRSTPRLRLVPTARLACEEMRCWQRWHGSVGKA
jgi:hypothetical protein